MFVNMDKLRSLEVRAPSECRFGAPIIDFEEFKKGRKILVKWAEGEEELGKDLGDDRYWQAIILRMTKNLMTVAIAGDYDYFKQMVQATGVSMNPVWVWDRSLFKEGHSLAWSLEEHDILWNCHKAVEKHGEEGLGELIVSKNHIHTRRKSFQWSLFPSSQRRMEIVRGVLEQSQDLVSEEYTDEMLEETWNSCRASEVDWEPRLFQRRIIPIKRKDIQSDVCFFCLPLFCHI